MMIEPDFGSFLTIHFTSLLSAEDEDDEDGRCRSVGASRTEESAWSTKGFCMSPVPVGESQYLYI